VPYKNPIVRREKDRFYKVRRRTEKPELYRSLDKKYRANNLEKVIMKERRYQMKQYGITVDDYNQMFTLQNGRCAICGVNQEGNLDVDHCHQTKKVRGLLCRKCNLAIGYFQDDPLLCKRASDYLL
jgi:hypothetical protein